MAQDSGKSDTKSGDQQERGIPADARVRFELLEDCREAVVGKLCTVISDALNKMSDELTALALKTMHREEQQALMDAVSVVRQNRSEIETRFRKAFVDCFERRLFRKKGDEKSASEFEGELELMDDSVISDKLIVDRLVHKARGKLDPDEVLGIRARLAALLERDWFEETQHPAAPEAIFEALKSALSDVAPSAEIQTALLDAFEPHVSANLNMVYTTVNDRLKARSILPRIKQQVSLVGGSTRRATGATSAAKPGPEAQPGAQSGAEGAAGHAGTHEVPGIHGIHGIQGAHGVHAVPAAGQAAMSGGASSVQSAGSASGHGFLDAGQQAELINALNLSMQQLSQGVPSARLSVARMLTDPDTFGVADLPLPEVTPNLIESIAHLQAASVDAPIADPQLLTDLAERARDKGSPLDQLTVEIVSMVFDYIYADKRLADVIKQQLLRLQVVAVKAALLDRSFFARRQHPMRQLIDRISEIASDPDIDLAFDSPVVAELEKLIAWILANFDSDLAIFDEAIGQLDVIAQGEAGRRAGRLSELTRDAEQIEARAAAREQAKALLADRVDENTPAFVKEFLLGFWSDATAAAGLSSEPDALRSADCVQVAEALIWSVVPKVPAEIPKLAGLLPKLIKGLTRGLKPVAIPEADREAFFNELLRVHTRAIESAKQVKPVETVAARGATRVRMRSDGSIKYTPPRAADVKPKPAVDHPTTIARSLTDVQRGDFIEVEDDGEFRQYKLAWVSPSQKLYILSRYPDEARSLDAGQFAALFSNGKARLVEKKSSVDSAIDRIQSSDSVGDATKAAESVVAKVPAAIA